MKLVHSSGAELTVRDVGPVLYRVTKTFVPIKHNGYRIVSDEQARALLEDLRASGAYQCERVAQ